MPFLESVQDGLDRILPRKKRDPIVSKSISGGMGGTAGIVRYQDDVRLFPACFLAPSFLAVAALVVATHLNLDVFSLRNSTFPPALQMLVWTSLARWSFSSSFPCYGSYGLRSFPLHVPSFTTLLTRFTDDNIEASHHLPHLSSLLQLPFHGLLRQRR